LDAEVFRSAATFLKRRLLEAAPDTTGKCDFLPYPLKHASGLMNCKTEFRFRFSPRFGRGTNCSCMSSLLSLFPHYRNGYPLLLPHQLRIESPETVQTFWPVLARLTDFRHLSRQPAGFEFDFLHFQTPPPAERMVTAAVRTQTIQPADQNNTMTHQPPFAASFAVALFAAHVARCRID
jgi:hypothetical protein